MISGYEFTERSELETTDSFDAAAYIEKYDDLLAAFGSNTVAATKHHVNHGYAEGRSI